MNFIKIIFILCIFFINIFGANSYYRLDNYDSSYKKLDDRPEPIEKKKVLHPSSIYKQSRPARVEKKPDYTRKDILPNNQALIRIGKPPKIKRHFLMLGVNTGINIFSLTDINKSKKYIVTEIMGKIGYLYYFNANALRIYLDLGARFPTNNNIPLGLAISSNFDFLINIIYLDFYIGAGYGGEYFIKDNFFSQGFKINLGISKSFKKHQIEFGITIPFYKFFINDIKILNHNIDFIFSYNYNF
ncbi:hypothetical protein [Helicobacter sp. MIT 14-3879]|uniref:hypothetical protein n=1 Tax=Helicobacter sp. MIT 14-3879 TaxID=2040649 RepID=UPI000E1F5AC2|nr:hypothetical protein [Helicobacter sp. MIT 14-3879]RDU65159.1 hypothetical protein CQA44_02275 [Helicobacter sp. MIT 14-3879]